MAARLAAYMRLFDWVSAFRLAEDRTAHTYRRCSSKPKRSPTSRVISPSSPRLQFKPLVSRLLREEAFNLFSPLECSELLLCLAGGKRLMRTSGSDARIRRIQRLARDLGLHTGILAVSGVVKLDRGKGTWSNLYEIDSSQAKAMKSMIFIGRVKQDVVWAQQHNDSNDAEFGRMLGYPSCCCAFYSRAFPLSLEYQGDLVPLIADQTAAPAPWPAGLNILGRYFGTGLINYYPCQFMCAEALAQAKAAFELLRSLNARANRLTIPCSG